MCTACGCKDTAVTIDAPVRNSTKPAAGAIPGYTQGSSVGGSNPVSNDANVIKGWNVPAPYGKGK